MEAWQQRVVEERNDLVVRMNDALVSIEALGAFLASEAYEALDPVQQTLLRDQARIMRSYLGVLSTRIEHYDPDPDTSIDYETEHL